MILLIIIIEGLPLSLFNSTLCSFHVYSCFFLHRFPIYPHRHALPLWISPRIMATGICPRDYGNMPTGLWLGLWRHENLNVYCPLSFDAPNANHMHVHMSTTLPHTSLACLCTRAVAGSASGCSPDSSTPQACPCIVTIFLFTLGAGQPGW